MPRNKHILFLDLIWLMRKNFCYVKNHPELGGVFMQGAFAI